MIRHRILVQWSIAHARAALLVFLSVGVPGAQAGLPEAVQRVKPSVVAVGTFQKTRSPAFVFRGTGFAVGDGTLVATNAHVVPEELKTENGETLMVLVQVAGARDPEARVAKVIALDKEHDLALLRIAGTPLPAVTLGDSDAVRDGQSIAFTGFPIGQVLGFHAITHRGIVASLTPIALPAANAKQLDAGVVRALKAAPVHPVSAGRHRLCGPQRQSRLRREYRRRARHRQHGLPEGDEGPGGGSSRQHQLRGAGTIPAGPHRQYAMNLRVPGSANFR